MYQEQLGHPKFSAISSLKLEAYDSSTELDLVESLFYISLHKKILESSFELDIIERGPFLYWLSPVLKWILFE